MTTIVQVSKVRLFSVSSYIGGTGSHVCHSSEIIMPALMKLTQSDKVTAWHPFEPLPAGGWADDDEEDDRGKGGKNGKDDDDDD